MEPGADPYHSLLTDPLLSIVDNSLHHSKYLLAPLREAFSKLFFCFSAPSRIQFTFPHPPSPSPSPMHFHFHVSCFRFPHESFAALFGYSSLNFPHSFQPFPLLSLAAALVPPVDPLPPAMLAIPPLGSPQRSTCECDRGCLAPAFPQSNWSRHAVEPITGIQFPSVLNNILAKENHSNLLSEVLVGTGSRVMTIIRIKTLKVYAFGFYIHPDSLCQKLGSKYGSVPAVELKKRHDFYDDLLREDIGMTIRLVVNYNGLKINKVKDAFEKSLRARLAKTNPETDFKCISKFGSYFTKDIPLPVGTVIDFRRTADGKLITEIGGNEIGAVYSKELCRAFFDMYIGEVPVSEQTKEEIGKNVAMIIGKC